MRKNVEENGLLRLVFGEEALLVDDWERRVHVNEVKLHEDVLVLLGRECNLNVVFIHQPMWPNVGWWPYASHREFPAARTRLKTAGGGLRGIVHEPDTAFLPIIVYPILE